MKNTNSNNLRITNKTDTEAEIIVYGPIGSYWMDSISAKDFSNELKKIPDTVKNITLRLNSPGGDVFDGITIFNRLKQHKAKVTVYVDGLAASIASIIMLAGDEIFVGEGAQVMIHKPWTMAAGNDTELEDTIMRLRDIEEQMLGIYSRKTGLDKNELRTMLAKETWMDAEESVSMGFATQAIDMDIKIAACSDAHWIRNKPTPTEKISASYKMEFDRTLEEMNSFLARK